MATAASLDLPQFNTTTLQNLTQQIQRGIAENKSKGSKAARNATIKGKRKEHGKKEQDQKREASGAKSDGPHVVAGRTEVERSGRPKKQVVRKAEPPAKGKKRMRNGDVKNPQASTADRVNDASRGSTHQVLKESANGGLKDEILALGGSIEDFKALKDLQSDDEVTGPKEKHVEGSLLKEIKGFVQGLGIDNVKPEFDAETEEEDEEQDATAEHTTPLQTGKDFDVKAVGKLMLQPLSEWHAAELASLPAASATQKAASPDLVERLHAHAIALLESENQVFATTQRSSSSSHQFYSTIMSTGTLSDKISALTLSVQESPLHNMKPLEQLLALARKKSRAQAVDVLGALKDLFGAGNLLPSDRKLLAFASQPQLHAALASNGASWADGKPLPKPLTESHLIFWAFEDWLKTVFFQVLQILESWSNDEVVFARGRATDYIFSLLKDKPEQEQNLLRLLVNKLGDRDKKVASKTSYRILQLETAHPAMKPTITAAIESDLLFRPNQSLHAQYYATITLNQTVLSNGEVDVAKKLIAIYFALFLKMLSRPENVEKKAEVTTTVQQVRLNRKGEVQGGGVSKPGKAARKKEEALAKAKVEDDQLKEKMIAAVLTGVNRAIPYVSTDDESFDQHLDTLFRVTHSSNFNTSIQALMLIQQIQGQSQVTADRFYRTLYESLLDPRLLTSSKQVLYLNLLYRALRADLNIDRIKAFTKRITQILTLHNAPFACAAIYLIRELENTFPSLSTFISDPEPDHGDDDEEFHDVPDDDQGSSAPPALPKVTSALKSPTLYDPRKRSPTHANAASSSLWETLPLTIHYHPSVSLFASKLLSHAAPAQMPPKPDLNLNTLIHFLDRFVNKNPKQGLRGKSVMQPLAHVDSAKGAILVGKTGREVAVEDGEARADEVVFQRYFAAKKGKAEKKREKKRRKMEDEDGGEIGDLGGDDKEGSEEEEEEDAEEGEVWDALVKSMPEIEGDDNDDVGFSDDDMDNLDDLDDSVKDGEDGEDVEDVEENDKVKGLDDDDGFPDFGSEDENDLIGSDREVDLAGTFKDEMEGNKDGKKKGRKERRKRLRSLPTFASVEAYEKMIGGDEEEGEEV